MTTPDSKRPILDGLFVTMDSPLLGTRTRRLAGGRVVVRHGDTIVSDEELAPTSGIDPSIADSDWGIAPWFAHPLSEEIERTLTSAGFPCDKRQIAVDGLRIAFPHEVCQEMAREEDRLEIIDGLYEHSVIVSAARTPSRTGAFAEAVCGAWQTRKSGASGWRRGGRAG